MHGGSGGITDLKLVYLQYSSADIIFFMLLQNLLLCIIAKFILSIRTYCIENKRNMINFRVIIMTPKIIYYHCHRTS